MTASVIYLQHCLTPQKRRIEHVAPRSIRSLAPDWQRPHIALLDGQAILRADWGRTLHHGETLAFVDVETIPQGGGGKSNPLQMVLMLAVMVTAGLYETSGDWLYDTGLPGKSGVSGGMITVIPGKGGLATYSPPLDDAGNSVRGQLTAQFLSERLGLNLFASRPAV